jgi:phosphoadenosine phosphosulfate reductase
MCPFKNLEGRLRDAKRYPKYYNAYLRAFQRLIDERTRRGKENIMKTPQEIMDWWLSDLRRKPKDENQLSLFA